MAKQIILHIDAILSALDPEPLWAVYMVVKQMYEIQKHSKERVS